MSKKNTKNHKPIGLWGKLFDSTVGTFIRMLSWSFLAIFFSILIEWFGMLIGWWNRHHSSEMLIVEINYLNQIGQNAILSLYPKEVATTLLTSVDTLVNDWGLRRFSQTLHGIFSPFAYAIEAAINIIYVFIVRLAVVIGIIPGLIIIFLLALADGLSERNIRTYCGGVESSWLYHHAKRLMLPSIIVFCGLYLTLPFSLNPLWVFLPLLFIFWVITFVWSSTFKKFL